MHRLYLLFLAVLLVAVAIVLWIGGGGYYALELTRRPFHPLFASLRPGGAVGHLYGIIGTALILAGVFLYVIRKRIRLFARIGKVKHFLQIHIALCLAGPILIVYHTTFKLGGLVSVGFWSMILVVMSGIVGRYLWMQIPRGIEGDALTLVELDVENASLLTLLKAEHEFNQTELGDLDRLLDAVQPAKASTFGTLGELIRHDMRLVLYRRELAAWLASRGVAADHVSTVRRIAVRRSLLHRKIQFLEQLQRLFRYWHVIHMPFTYILLGITIVHVAVAFFFGYGWGG
jgi:hypothetical protein